MTNNQHTIELSEIVEIPWNLLRKGEANVRVVAPGNAEDEALIANIAETGIVLENLIVTPLSEEEGTFGVHAGGRRWSAIGFNVKNGVLPETFPVPCRIQTGGSLTAVSLAENLQAPMHPADEFAAFKDMLDEGLSIEDIALSFGMPQQRVRQRLKLAQVAKRILNAYRRDEMDLKCVMAFTLASSQKRQLEVYKELAGRCYAHAVKHALTGETINSDDRLVKYIGIEAYTAEGGTVVADMFAEHDHLQDRGLVERLAFEKLLAAAARLKKKEGWQNVKVTLDRYFSPHEYHHIEPEPVGVPDELTKRLASLIAEQNELHEQADDWTDELEAKDARLTDAIDEAEREIDSYREYTDEHKATGLCFITISEPGKTAIARGYLTRNAARKAKAKDSEGTAPSKAIPQALVNDLGAHRQQIAKVALLSDPALASDLLLYTLCQEVLDRGYERRAMEARIEPVRPRGEQFEGCQAMQCLDKAHSKLPTDWMSIESPMERVAALRKLTPKRKASLMAYCVSASFIAGPYSAGEDNIVEAVLQDLQPDYAASWRPTGDEYFKRLTLPMLIELGTDLFGDEWAQQHRKDKKKELVAWFDHFFVGPMPKGLSDELKTIRNEWLPAGFVQEVSA